MVTWIAEADYDPDRPGDFERAQARIAAAAAIVRAAGIECTIGDTPRTDDPAGGYVFGPTGFWRLYVAPEVEKKGRKLLKASGWPASHAARKGAGPGAKADGPPGGKG